ncbi:hypothetical protein TraAM80_05944 [Trypanosoma rangeli]|uniref:Uncharacterized protein n=1 Tax=Trypanosoma rangeli TaxID=5698 RepID=A0A422NCM8_TRYRA|nr:uncharacterized protein TraAM80_05944 [Trypanosoma rangeli]RNF03238.1 hypothetical protein TraAM80_05944 [Trypanosoma rangeli]|eukprot:RNF03238.1 hypothetical protein TraAM80_05944 [Trypanosoma rangeli]
MTPFKLPHLCAFESYAEIAVELATLRQLPKYADFEKLLRDELQRIYGGAPEEFRGVITYSTRETPQRFTGCFTECQLETLHQYDATVEKAKSLGSEYQTAVEEHERVVEANKDRKRTQKRIREEAKSKKRLHKMHHGVVTAEYEVECLALKLKNLFAIDVIRVPLN